MFGLLPKNPSFDKRIPRRNPNTRQKVYAIVSDLFHRALVQKMVIILLIIYEVVLLIKTQNVDEENSINDLSIIE